MAILVTIIIFQHWKTSQEEQSGHELLESQINTIKTHIREIEKLYGDIRSLRHDMGNYIQMIERLMETGNSAEASAYLGRLKKNGRSLRLRSGQGIRLRI